MSAPPDKSLSCVHTRVLHEHAQLLAEDSSPHGLELDLVDAFVKNESVGQHDPRLPMSCMDTIVTEMSFRYGRADIVVFHIDGSASVIEAKDGTRGYNHVVSGIGQAALYAVQLANTKGALKKVRTCLLWTSTGDLQLDGVIEQMCHQASVVPLPWMSMKSLMAIDAATSTVLKMMRDHGRT